MRDTNEEFEILMGVISRQQFHGARSIVASDGTENKRSFYRRNKKKK